MNGLFSITPNGLKLPEDGELEVLHFQPNTNFYGSAKLDLITSQPLLGRCCYSQWYLSNVFVNYCRYWVVVSLRVGSAWRFFIFFRR